MTIIALLLTLGCNKAPENPIEMLDVRCNRGEAEACFTLGTRELNAPLPDYAKARKLFSDGCRVHHGASCNALGALVRDARGGPKDMVRAKRLFRVSCENGLPLGCVHYADVLAADTDTEGMQEKAVELYSQECMSDASIAKACNRLGQMLLAGEGVAKKDDEKAIQMFTKACDNDFAPACVEHAQILLGKRGKDNTATAAELLDKACSIDANFGCYELGQLHQDEKAPDANIEQAGHYYQRVCSHDHSKGCYELAELMAEEEIPSRAGEKEALYTRACESGNSEACSKR